MNKIVTKRQIAIGFFGWVIFENLFFLILALSWTNLLRREDQLVWIIIWLPVIITALVLVVKKRYWVCFGIATAIILNLAAWVVFYALIGYLDLEELALVARIPFPAGMLAFMN